ncbi:HlyD family secretion protein [Plebeiibacterium marinum]|uniref:HlyD family secretion protein n=1 Tax=Plebeiibacterium marinum TaxID=2992111 RepID=A0AAE3MB59_9BACT|nr:HlyD family secretion protein [Plebeiobacterium marinum]MCW3804493.1 HlyD family secretion protein [Plebeiobacterium marinum]
MSAKLKKYEKIDHIAVRITYGVALSILVVLVVWGSFLMVNFFRYEETNDAQVKEYINPILSRTNGYVQTIKYKDHQKIHKGDTLVVLDIEEAKVQLLEAKAGLAAAEARLNVLRSNLKTAFSSTQISQAKIGSAKAQMWQQQKEFNRYQKLWEGEAITQQQFEDIQTKLEVAKANYEAMTSSLQVSQAKTSDVNARIAVAEADIEQKKAVLERARLDIKYAVITAPADGYMGNKTIQQGQYIPKGQIIGFMVDENQGKWIVANFEETQIAKMQKGQEARITIDAFPDETFHGKIESLSPATGSQFSLLPPDNATGNFVKITQRFPVRIQFTDDNVVLDKLRAGMNAEVYIPKL